MLHIKKQQQKIKAPIILNLQATNERLGKIATEMDELSGSLEFMQNQLDEELWSGKQGITILENNIKSTEKDLFDPDEVSAKLVELEERSWWNNFQIDGLQETPNETWKTCEK